MKQELQYSVVVAAIIAAALASPVEHQNGTKERVSCSEDFISLGSSCYFFSDVFETYDNARDYCRSMLSEEAGVDLAVLGPGNEEFGHVSSYMQANGLTPMFVGVNDNANDGVWVWVDGTVLPSSSVMWYCTEPTAGESYNCGALNDYSVSSTNRIYLDSFQCTSLLRFICESGVRT